MDSLPLLLASSAGRDFDLPLAMLLIFGSAKLLGEIAMRLRLPALVGEILAGVLIGPSILGWIGPNPFLHSLADLGVMFLLFTVGLEVRAAELKRVGGPATLVAMGGVVLPFLAGWAILTFSGAGQIAAFFMGAAFVATSVGITAQVLQTGGFLHLRASRIMPLTTASTIKPKMSSITAATRMILLARRCRNPPVCNTCAVMPKIGRAHV